MNVSTIVVYHHRKTQMILIKALLRSELYFVREICTVKLTVSLFSEGLLFIVSLYFTVSPYPSGTMWLRV